MAVAPKKEDEADELGHQQDKKLIPSLTAGVDAAAEDEASAERPHNWTSEQPLCHQSQKRHKERNRERTIFFSIDIISGPSFLFALIIVASTTGQGKDAKNLLADINQFNQPGVGSARRQHRSCRFR